MSKEDRATHLNTAEETMKNVFLSSLKVKIDSEKAKKEAEEKRLAKIAGKMHDAGGPVK